MFTVDGVILSIIYKMNVENILFIYLIIYLFMHPQSFEYAIEYFNTLFPSTGTTDFLSSLR